MEFTYTTLKQKQVINTTDGKNLGRVCDIIFDYPQYKIKAIIVTGGRAFSFSNKPQELPITSITKIGEDVILTNFGTPPPKPTPPPCPPNGRRSFEEYE